MTPRLKTQILRRHAALHNHDGFTMILTLLVLLITSVLLVAAFTAANGEIHLTSTDTAQKKAYYAAEAGIEDYEYHLTQDGNYLSNCTSPKPPNKALNQVEASPLRRAVVESTSAEQTHEEYAIQLLPAESSPERKCNPNKLVETMVEEKPGGAVGTFRIESTGYSGGAERTLVATFKNANFVSYVWYTKYETGDPIIYGEPPTGDPANYFTECGNFFGIRPPQGGSPERCRNNFFINGEAVNGPLHTGDHGGVCGSPTFGRNPNDRIEFGNGGSPVGEGYSNEPPCGAAASPVFKGKHIPPKEVLSIEPPPGDEELKHIVEPAYLYAGKTEIFLQGSTMTVTNSGVTTPNVAYPSNGVIYVTGGCSKPYSPFGPVPGYTEDASCGNVYVHGEYTGSLTIAAENDVVINGNLTTPVNTEGVPTTNALLGLIANNFVRIYHPVEETYVVEHYTPKIEAGFGAKGETCNSGFTYNKALGKCVENPKAGYTFHESELVDSKSCNTYKGHVETYLSKGTCEYTEEASGCDAPNSEAKDLKEPTIYAAMLAVKHAVIVDNFNCGTATLNNLNVYGAVAGLYTNGFTGEFSGSSIIHGYPYNANYDNRLQVEEPPHFLNPIEAAWYIQRQTIAPNP